MDRQPELNDASVDEEIPVGELTDLIRSVDKDGTKQSQT